MGSFASDRSSSTTRSRGVGEIDVPSFQKDEQIVSQAQSLQEEVNSFFSDVESAVGTLQEEIQKASDYAQSIKDVFEKLAGFRQPLEEVQNSNFPETVKQGASNMLSKLNDLLNSLESEFKRAVDFIEKHSGGGSNSASSGAGGSAQSSSLPTLPSGLSGRPTGRGVGQTFEKNEELLQQSRALIEQLEQFEELPSDPSGGGASAQVLIEMVNPSTGETKVARDAAEAEQLRQSGFVRKDQQRQEAGFFGGNSGTLLLAGGAAAAVWAATRD